MRFQRVDRPIRWETLGFWGETVERWCGEGLPREIDPHSFLGLEPIRFIEVSSGFVTPAYLPPFQRETVEETPQYVVFRGSDGIVRREFRAHGGRSMPQWLRFPVESRADWEAIRARLDPDAPGRYPDWDAVRLKYADRTYPLGMTVCGAYGSPRSFFGEQRLAYAYFDDPGLVSEMMEWWADFYVRLIVNVTSRFSGIDYLYLWEDMCFKTGPLISPAFVERFMMPGYERVIGQARSCGIDTFLLDTDGNAEALLDLFVAAGVNAFFPLEAAAGMDPISVRRRYGHRLAFWGGIDKRAVAAGREAMREEVMKKVPPLLKDGGFIPGLDHLVPPDTSYDDFRAFLDLVRELGEKYGA